VGIERVILLVMDSVGAGATPDADRYGDAGANTLGHVAEAAGGADLPTMAGLGLGNLVPMRGVAPAARPRGAFGRMAEASAGKDTATGHWELAGLRIDRAFRTFPDGFPEEILAPVRQRTGRGVLGNRAASGTEIIQELGDQHRQTGDLIVYTSADSVFQIAAHEETVPIEEQYRICTIAREILDPYDVGRVIARPFVGARKGEYKRTYNRKDYAMPPPEPTLLDRLTEARIPVIGVGKIPDIYCHRGIGEEVHTEGNADGMRHTREVMRRVERGLVFVNLVDFDSLYGHRRDPAGYYKCLREFDAELAQLAREIDPGRDLVIITADHGNDPTFPGTDHTREYVPLIAFGPPHAAGVDLGVRATFADVGATVADIFQVAAPAHGTSFLRAIA
jgi:phosphopentomutase